MTILARQRLATWGVALALLPLAACNADRSNAFNATVPTPAAAAATMGVQDTKFINAAGPSDQFELQTSQIALERSRRADVRAYAQMMIDQHTASAQQLTLLAGAKGATVSQGLDPTQERLLAAVRSAGPSGFDRTYLNGQVLGHTATVMTYNDEISGGVDPDTKALAQQTLPMIQQHLQEARRLQGRR